MTQGWRNVHKKMRKQSGFTLIELLIVVAIIGVLAGMVTINLQDARERARDAQRKSDVKQIQNALELYKNDQNPTTYPPTDTWEDDIVTGGYMKKIPIDPTFDQLPTAWTDYTYTRDVDDALIYTLVACIENSQDPDLDAVNTCTYGYSYTLTEP